MYGITCAFFKCSLHKSRFDVRRITRCLNLLNKCLSSSQGSHDSDPNYNTGKKLSALIGQNFEELNVATDELKNIPGSQTSDEKMIIQFTCKVCDTTSLKKFSKRSYEHGVVLVRCPSCQNLHVIADRLGYFGDKDWDIEKYLQEQEQKVANDKPDPFTKPVS